MKNRKHNRRSIRLKNHDYCCGLYFVTICIKQKGWLFGEIDDGVVMLNEYGKIVSDEWLRTEQLRSNVFLDDFVIMPDHFHGIIGLNYSCRGTARCAPTNTPREFGTITSASLPTIIRSFKSASAKAINKLDKTPNSRVWQRNYYERKIRNIYELQALRQYIKNNPRDWCIDHEF